MINHYCTMCGCLRYLYITLTLMVFKNIYYFTGISKSTILSNINEEKFQSLKVQIYNLCLNYYSDKS